MTKDEYLADMDAKDPKRRNAAIQEHRKEILGMTEAEFKVHHADLQARFRTEAVRASIRRMIRDI